uniref:Uncharacterized protein n=1 Tax=Glossina palpalis gambiensis TaxID=67801 RepID=A0A1B0BVF7_9MUSC
MDRRTCVGRINAVYNGHSYEMASIVKVNQVEGFEASNWILMCPPNYCPERDFPHCKGDPLYLSNFFELGDGSSDIGASHQQATVSPANVVDIWIDPIAVFKFCESFMWSLTSRCSVLTTFFKFSDRSFYKNDLTIISSPLEQDNILPMLPTDLNSHPVVVVEVSVIGAVLDVKEVVVVVALVFGEIIVVVVVCAVALILDKVLEVVAVGGLSGGLSALDPPAIVPAVAVAAVVGEQNDDGAEEGVAAVDLGT